MEVFFVNSHIKQNKKISHIRTITPNLPVWIFPSSRSFDQTINHIHKLIYLVPYLKSSHYIILIINIATIMFSLHMVLSAIWLYHRNKSLWQVISPSHSLPSAQVIINSKILLTTCYLGFFCINYLSLDFPESRAYGLDWWFSLVCCNN